MHPVSRITDAFAARTSAGQLAFIPFVTAGDPDLAFTQRLIRELAASGADLIEVGFPYSDPIADGPVIQSSYTRALNKHVKLAEIFAAVKEVTSQCPGRSAASGTLNPTLPPLLAMVSYAIVFRHGAEDFVREAKDAGFAGLIVPDLPGDEAAEFVVVTQRAGLALVQLVAPTTPLERLTRILEHASGFVYCIAVAGTTGVREALPSELTGMLQRLRQQTSLPLAVGFGIGRPEQVRQLKGLADGAIVGSALVRCLEEAGNRDAAAERVRTLATQLSSSAHGE